MLQPGAVKPQVVRLCYEFPVPADCRARVLTEITRLMCQESYLIQRTGRNQPLDVRASLESLELAGDVLRMQLRESGSARVRPREVLEVLGLADLERQGCCLTRTAVELAS